MNVRHAGEGDFTWLVGRDRHVNDAWVSRCIASSEYLLCEIEGDRVGYLRYSLFWGTIPYMDMIFVLERHRRVGVGTALFDAWEAQMKEGGARILMTSSTSEERQPQAWHRRNGFERSGQLTFGRADPSSETFFVKDL